MDVWDQSSNSGIDGTKERLANSINLHIYGHSENDARHMGEISGICDVELRMDQRQSDAAP